MKGILFGLASAIGILGLFDYDWPLSSLDRSLYDRAIRVFWADDAAPNEIVIAAIDSSSLRAVGDWPWPRARHAEAIEQLTQDGAKAIYLDVGIFDPDRADPTGDQRLVEATARAGNVVYPMTFEEVEVGGVKRVVPLEPLAELAAAAAGIAHANLGLGADGVVRAVHLAYRMTERTYWGPSVEILRRYLGLPPDAIEARGTSVVRIGEIDVPVGADSLTLSWERDEPLAEYEMNIGFFTGADAFPSTSVAELLEGRFPRGTFDGKIVLYGVTAAQLGDSHSTPLSTVDLMPGVTIQGHAIATILTHRFVRTAGLGWVTATALATALAWGWVRHRWPRRCSGWVLIALLFVLVLAHLVLMGGFRVWLPATPVGAGLVLTHLTSAASEKWREKRAARDRRVRRSGE